MKAWLKAATVRALKTAAQTTLALVGTSQFIHEINWVAILSAVCLATLASYLTSIAGIPEVDGGESLTKIDSASSLGNSPANAPTIEEEK